MIEIAIGYVLLINLFAFSLFGIDKRKAVKRKWRIPEATLLTVAALGGGAGALLGMYTFHHKTRKPKFYVLGFFLLKDFLLAFTANGRNKHLSL